MLLDYIVITADIIKIVCCNIEAAQFSTAATKIFHQNSFSYLKMALTKKKKPLLLLSQNLNFCPAS